LKEIIEYESIHCTHIGNYCHLLLHILVCHSIYYVYYIIYYNMFYLLQHKRTSKLDSKICAHEWPMYIIMQGTHCWILYIVIYIFYIAPIIIYIPNIRIYSGWCIYIYTIWYLQIEDRLLHAYPAGLNL